MPKLLPCCGFKQGYTSILFVLPMQIESRGMVVARVMCGSFMTSLEMAGFSISLMRTNQETLRLFGECAGIVLLLHKIHTEVTSVFFKTLTMDVK